MAAAESAESLLHASAVSLGGGYFAVARASAGGASVTVLDARALEGTRT